MLQANTGPDIVILYFTVQGHVSISTRDHATDNMPDSRLTFFEVFPVFLLCSIMRRCSVLSMFYHISDMNRPDGCQQRRCHPRPHSSSHRSQ